jgi:hypothetical protein
MIWSWSGFVKAISWGQLCNTLFSKLCRKKRRHKQWFIYLGVQSLALSSPTFLVLFEIKSVNKLPSFSYRNSSCFKPTDNYNKRSWWKKKILFLFLCLAEGREFMSPPSLFLSQGYNPIIHFKLLRTWRKRTQKKRWQRGWSLVRPPCQILVDLLFWFVTVGFLSFLLASGSSTALTFFYLPHCSFSPCAGSPPPPLYRQFLSLGCTLESPENSCFSLKTKSYSQLIKSEPLGWSLALS